MREKGGKKCINTVLLLVRFKSKEIRMMVIFSGNYKDITGHIFKTGNCNEN